ncbi:MAG TPA: GDSL-type esterase/lipase family protein [Thermoanaerobaculia bacterium]|nr:GDSL-type esterase/lipase family protein [Thermoanaerobaculia bacterium]
MSRAGRATARRTLAVGALLAVGSVAAPADAATRVLLAFGDSITAGVGDTRPEPERGYPTRLQALLADAGVPAEVRNLGVPGETTAEGLLRLPAVIAGGGNLILLMEGTNDVSRGVSPETIAFNLREMGRLAAQRGIEPIFATLLPRGPADPNDPQNTQTELVAWELRDRTYRDSAGLVDPFAVFGRTEDLFARFYSDPYHPNPEGYDLLAKAFAEMLLGIDTVAPVAAFVSPADGSTGVPPTRELSFYLYDHVSGVDAANATMLVDGLPVAAELSSSVPRRIGFVYRPATPLANVVRLGFRARDLATPPNEIEETVATFIVAGTTLLTGDLDLDGRVDGRDLVAFAVLFGSASGDGRYEARADFNSDGRIDGLDLAALAANFGKSAF